MGAWLIVHLRKEKKTLMIGLIRPINWLLPSTVTYYSDIYIYESDCKDQNTIKCNTFRNCKCVKKVKQSRYRPGVAQRVRRR